jgi:hypothetical protein
MFSLSRSALLFLTVILFPSIPVLAATELSSARGGSGGATFLDMPTGRIAKVRIRAGKYVDSIQVAYRHGNKLVWGPRHGGAGGNQYDISIAKDERIIEIGGRSGKYVDAIYIRTNKKKYAVRGGNGGNPFRVKGKIIGFWGRSGSLLDAVGVVKKGSTSTGGLAVKGVDQYQPASGGGGDKADSAPSLIFPQRNANSNTLTNWLKMQNSLLLRNINTLAGSQNAFKTYKRGERSFCDGNLYCEIAYRQDAISYAIRSQ